MSEVVDENLLKELCQRHQVPVRLARKIIAEFATVELPKKNYIQEMIENWDKYVDKKTGS